MTLSLPTVAGYGKSFASFGEIVQGRTSDDIDFLVTLPVDLWSTCELVCTQVRSPLMVECELEKSRAVVEYILQELGLVAGYHIDVRFTRNIPVGKGLSSSTADMLAALRALQEVFGFLLTEQFISNLFNTIEPHDALHYNNCVIYNHRRGNLIYNLGHIPRYRIIAVDNGGAVDTLQYNRTVSFTSQVKADFDRLMKDLIEAFRQRDERAIAACATRSATIHVAMTGNTLLERALSIYRDYEAIGVLATHSGTCAGFLFTGEVDDAAGQRIAEDLKRSFNKDVFMTKTLRLIS